MNADAESAILNRLAALERAVAELRGQKKPARRPEDERLLRAIASEVGLGIFCVSDLSPSALGRLSPWAVGKALSRMSGREVAGYHVERLSKGPDGCLWRVMPPTEGLT